MNYFLPHIGELNFRVKALYLGYIVKQFAYFTFGYLFTFSRGPVARGQAGARDTPDRQRAGRVPASGRPEGRLVGTRAAADGQAQEAADAAVQRTAEAALVVVEEARAGVASAARVGVAGGVRAARAGGG